MNNSPDFYSEPDTLPERLRAALNDRTRMQHLLVCLVGVLICVGVQMVQSASLTSRPSEQDSVFLGRHLAYLALSMVCAWVASNISAEWLQRYAVRMYAVLLFLLVILLVPGIGSRVNGAQRWLRFSGFSLQPSELGRIVMPILAASMLIKLRNTSGFGLKTVPRVLFPILIVAPVVAIEPDLGATVFLLIGYSLTLFLGGWPLRYFVTCACCAIPAAASLLILRPYQVERISGFMDAWENLSQAPWQIRQSLMSIGSGGLKGTGIGSGWQKLSYLPEANTDFVFAVIGEELGLLGTLALCFVWISVFLTGCAALRHLPRTSFEWILGTTLLVQLLFQAMANIAVVTALVPPKGVPHPFISYGGTNLLVSLIAVGLIVGMSRTSKAAG
ncbi:MAG: cell division protein FtsW [Planctomycetota bacterium]|jgi:cell division protein FtsW|nr:putative peptidoglycan glycosyltransferase FtsW [Planctomycetales bacterium]RLT06334.1 MAG: cell division protein FtsW [Planctomycetota bacterium]